MVKKIPSLGKLFKGRHEQGLLHRIRKGPFVLDHLGAQRHDDCRGRHGQRQRPPKSTVNGYFLRWTDDLTLDRLHQALYLRCWELAERESSPTAANIQDRDAGILSMMTRGLGGACAEANQQGGLM
jgi:hypothetical protein